MVFIEGIKGRGKAKVKREGGEKMEGMKKGIVVGVLAAALLVSMVGIASANSITWDLNSDDVMYKDLDHTENGCVYIPVSSSHVWTSENNAVPAEGVYFKTQTWDGRLTIFASDTEYTVEIGYSDAGGANFQSKGSGGQVFYAGLGSGASFFAILDVTGFTVPQGKYLAFRVNTGSTGRTVTTDGSSKVSWPCNEPLWPVPELPTIILTSAGLLALMGYVGLRTRKNK